MFFLIFATQTEQSSQLYMEVWWTSTEQELILFTLWQFIYFIIKTSQFIYMLHASLQKEEMQRTKLWETVPENMNKVHNGNKAICWHLNVGRQCCQESALTSMNHTPKLRFSQLGKINRLLLTMSGLNITFITQITILFIVTIKCHKIINHTAFIVQLRAVA